MSGPVRCLLGLRVAHMEDSVHPTERPSGEGAIVPDTTEGSNPEDRLRVLCVDDYVETADTEATLLRLVGFNSRACYCGAMALRIAQEFRPDVCLIDLNM